jgi:polyferredoxin
MRKKWLFILCSFFLIAAGSFAQDSSLNALDEFQEFTTDSSITTLSSPAKPVVHKKSIPVEIYWTTSILLFTILAGIFVRYKNARQLRSLFLVISLVIFGFYRGGCPCSIQSLQHGILSLTGMPVKWPLFLLFAGLIPITYLFGRVYCGWICHLGAFQEFIFKTSSFKFFQSERSQKIMRVIRIVVLIILIVQLLITHSYLYKKIDPFVAVFNFYSDYSIGWVLVFILIASSVLLYRPFCKTVCPVGLTLGWISKIPGASVLGPKQNCNSCLLCSKGCDINAITHDTKISVLDNQECIRCGKCLTGCKKNAIGFYRKTKQHPDKAECKPIPVTIEN